VAVALVAGCGGGPAGVSDSTPATEGATPTEATAPAAATPDAGDALDVAEGSHVVARAASDLDISAVPEGDVVDTLPATTEFGSPRALLVVDAAGDWLEVALPTRPNGNTGWIARTDVTLRTIDESIVIDLESRTLTLFDGETEVLTTPVAIGTDDNPTPTGDFYVVDKLDTGDPGGPYGQFAFGLSAHSDVLTEFAGGDGRVGIHGTDDPGSIGRAASHGCVRVPNDVAQRLADSVNLGTPVVVA
jgi:lipoprotein-anchoring transpeptidase ErfK/SrfK